MTTIEEAWRAFRLLRRSPDTAEMRAAFFCGAHHTINAWLECQDDDPSEAFLRLNDELLAFVRPQETV